MAVRKRGRQFLWHRAFADYDSTLPAAADVDIEVEQAATSRGRRHRRLPRHWRCLQSLDFRTDEPRTLD
jgi:hypothetical protein